MPGAGPVPGGNGKLGGNPPREFTGDRSMADAFMNEFNLYQNDQYRHGTDDNSHETSCPIPQIHQGIRS